MNIIRKTALAIKGGPGGGGLFLDAFRRLIVTKGPNPYTQQSVVVTRSKDVVAKTAAFTVVFPDDDGKVFTLDAAAGIVVTLPAVSAANAGMSVTVVAKTLVTSNAYQLSPAAADSIKYGVDDKDLILTAATDALGDSVTVVSDGSVGYFVPQQVGIWAKEA